MSTNIFAIRAKKQPKSRSYMWIEPGLPEEGDDEEEDATKKKKLKTPKGMPPNLRMREGDKMARTDRA